MNASEERATNFAGQRLDDRAVRSAFGAFVGVVAALIIVLLLRYSSSAFYSDIDETRAGRGSALLTALGIAVLGIVIVSRWSALVAAVPAVILGLLYYPLFMRGAIPSYLPSWITEALMISTGTAPPVIIGVLAATVAWRYWERGLNRVGATSTRKPSSEPAGEQEEEASTNTPN